MASTWPGVNNVPTALAIDCVVLDDRRRISMRDIVLQRNRLTGSIPSELGNLTDMYDFIVGNNTL